MLFVGIDLAERHSAAVVLDQHLTVVAEHTNDTGTVKKGDSPLPRIVKHREWLTDVLGGGILAETIYVVIEEPYPHAVNVAPSYRIQGSLLSDLLDYGIEPQRIRITKSKPWQDYFGYTKAEFGNSKAWAALMVEGFGYVPGQTWEKKTLAKQREDLNDAYLLARWLKETT